MNEEIKKELDKKFGYFAIIGGKEFYNGAFDPSAKTSEVAEWIDQKLKEQYLQGAKDMREAVKFKRTGWQDVMVTIVLDTIEKQAQQFIDSLEGKDEQENSHR